MSNIYYKIWADAIVHERAKKDRQSSWKAFTIAPMSILLGTNLLTLLLLLRLLSHKTYLVIFPLHVFNQVGLNTCTSIILTYFIPFVIINYLLIFYNDRYKQLIIKYGSNGGKLYHKYALITIGVIVVPILFKLVFL
jgi:hypothetical protein